MKLPINSKFIFPVTAIIILTTSCLKNDFEEKEKEELDKINQIISDYGFIESEKLESGIYLKFHKDNTESDTIKPKTGNTILVQYTGKYSDGTVFETTDPDEGAKLVPERYFVYGDIRLKMGDLVYGFDTTLRFLSPGDSVSMLIPSKFMWYDYNPVVYDVVLKDIILNDSTYEHEMFNEFFKNNEFSTNNYFGINSNSDTLYYKIRITDKADTLSESPIEVAKSDSIVIGLEGFFAESYYADGSGRKFYPLTTYPQEFIYTYGSGAYFPILPAIDTAVKHMALGDIIEICGKASWAYGDDGFSDDYYNIVAVPPRTPVHYKIKLLGHRKDNEWSYAE
jgi:FKBP-type peptidyl-prolyl cis-trans isomerase